MYAVFANIHYNSDETTLTIWELSQYSFQCLARSKLIYVICFPNSYFLPDGPGNLKSFVTPLLSCVSFIILDVTGLVATRVIILILVRRFSQSSSVLL